GWRSEVPSIHLTFGRLWHEALESIYRNAFSVQAVGDALTLFDPIEEWGDRYGNKSAANARAGLIEYAARYARDVETYEIDGVEEGGSVLIAPDRYLIFNKDIRAHRRGDGKPIIIEHKTASSTGPTWSRQWALSLQVGTYIYSEKIEHDLAVDCLVNCTCFLKAARKFERVLCMRSEEMLKVWLVTVNALYSELEFELQVLAECGPQDTVLQAFPLNPSACSSYAGCPYHDYCTSWPNPLRYAPEPPLGFTIDFWNPCLKA
ncbi:MAG: hypothetical protein RR609_09060, partial [Aurantimicrobium sp.]